MGSNIELEGKFAPRASLASYEPKQISLFGRILGFDVGKRILLMQVERKVLDVHYLEDELPLVQVAELYWRSAQKHMFE